MNCGADYENGWTFIESFWSIEIGWLSVMAKKKASIPQIVTNVFFMLIYVIWRERNRLRFQRGSFFADMILKEIVMHI